MSRYMSYVSKNYEDAERFCMLLKGSVFGYRQGATDRFTEVTSARLKIPSHRWARGSHPNEKLNFSDLWEHHLKVAIQTSFRNHPQGYVGFISSGGGDVKEIVFVRSGASHKKDTPNTHKQIVGWPAVGLLAFHQSLAIFRGLRKVDSVVTNSAYRVVTAPLDLTLWLEKQAGERLGAGVNNESHVQWGDGLDL